MAKTAEITLGDATYTVRSFTLEELEEVTDLIQMADTPAKTNKLPFSFLKIALRRAEPKPEGSIEATVTQVRAANKVLLELAGLKGEDDGDPPKSQETGEA